MVQNRLLLIQSIFRENNLYAFWYLNRIITRELFFRNWSSRHRGVKNASDPKAADNITRLFGTVMPSSIPESTAWWRNQQKELSALSDDSDNGLMQTMLTVTLNDSSPELSWFMHICHVICHEHARSEHANTCSQAAQSSNEHAEYSPNMAPNTRTHVHEHAEHTNICS